jgi:hypothetical protein
MKIKLADANTKIAALSQEKEHLRHKVIRLNLNAKGEGENSIENMLKRISRVSNRFLIKYASQYLISTWLSCFCI